MRTHTLLLFACIVCLVPAVLAGDIVRDEDGIAALRLGACVSGLGDQDGDGDDELLVGAPGYQGGADGAGRVYLWFGGHDIALNADRIWSGSGTEQFGRAVARIGDVNADGIDDFAVGAPMSDVGGSESGRVYVFYGGEPLPAGPDLTLDSPAVGGRFGWAIAALGDLNGDGDDDFAVGAPWADGTGLEAGAAYVFYGGAGGPADTPDLSLDGALAYEHFGWSVAGVADFLGGSANCLAVGAPANGSGAGTRQGSVFIYEGTTSPSPGPDAAADLTLQTSATVVGDNEFGYSVAGIGRYDGDSDPDLAVGSPFSDDGGLERGRVEIFYGGSDADAVADRYVGGPAANARLGWSVAGVGDITGTSADDLVLGAPYDDSLGNEAGRAFILPGGASNVSDADNLDEVLRDGLVTAPAGDHFGSWCTALGDFDGDGEADYAVGAPEGNTSSNAVAGWVRFVDSSGEAVPVQIGGWQCAWQADGSVVGSLNTAGLDASMVAGLSVVRRAGGRTLALPAGSARLEGRRIAVHDRDAAWQTRDEIRYDLHLTLAGGDEIQAELAGPAGPRPGVWPRLEQVAPNPFNPATMVSWRAESGTPVTVTVLDVRGRLVRELFRGAATGSRQQARWDGRSHGGAMAAAGVYVVRLQAGQHLATRRVTLLP